jgi:hypothetical protein
VGAFFFPFFHILLLFYFILAWCDAPIRKKITDPFGKTDPKIDPRTCVNGCDKKKKKKIVPSAMGERGMRVLASLGLDNMRAVGEVAGVPVLLVRVLWRSAPWC